MESTVVVNSNHWQQLLQQGIDAARQGNGPQALQLLQQVMNLRPDSREAAYWLGNAQRLCGQFARAEKSYRALLNSKADDFDVTFSLAFLLREQGRMEEIEKLMLSLARQPQMQAKAQLQIAGFLRDGNQFEAAIKIMQGLLEQDPANAAHHLKLARMYQGTGQFRQALQSYRSALHEDPNTGGAWLGLSQLQNFSDPLSDDWKLISSASPGDLEPEARMCLAFARGKGFNDLRDYPAAWRQFILGNQMRSASQLWDRQAWHVFLERVLAAPLPLPHSVKTNRKPIFIIGMLRSGTTLLEQLLDQHPGIVARGELNFLAHAWKQFQDSTGNEAIKRELAAELWSRMKLDGSADAAYVDKNPLNFRYLSMVAEIFPEAKILHVKRDGRDSCLSCYTQLFQHPDAAFANRLDDLQHFYQGYLQLMAHFEKHLSHSILTINYEDLVANSTSIIEKVLGFLQLPTGHEADNVSGSAQNQNPENRQQRPIRTASSWQARQAVHSNSIGRWKDYYAMAPEFFDAMEKLDQQFA